MAIHRGKTAELLANKSKIVSGDKVIITDNLYEIDDIIALNTASERTIKLEKTSAATVFQGDAGDLIDVLKLVESYTGPVRATDALGSSAEDINTLAGLTTGVVTGTITSAAVDSDLVASLTNVKTTDKISFKADADPADATDIVALKAKLPLANFSAIAEITGAPDDIAALKSAANIVKSAKVTVDPGEISAANANALAKISNGIVTAKVTAGTAAALNKALVDAKSTDALTLTVSGKIATAADLKALAGKTSAAVVADSIETITGNAKDVRDLLALGTGEITLGAKPAITVSGTISADDARIIASDAKAGVVTANVAAGTASYLNGALGTGPDVNDKLSLTVLNNLDGSATKATDLKDLDGKTALPITVNAKAIEGEIADLTAIYESNFKGLGNKAVTITDLAPVAADAVNDILKATSGVVTATVAENDAADLREALADAKATDALKLKVTGSATAADLKALDAKTSIAVDATDSGITVSGNAADIKAVIKSTGVNLADNAVITVSGKISAADANTIASATRGVVTAEVTAGSAAALNKALVDPTNSANNKLTLTVTGATAAASDLNGLNNKTIEVVDATAVKTITGLLVDLNTVYAAPASEIKINAETNATVNGILTVDNAADLRTLLTNVVNGKVTATVAPSTAAALAAALDEKGASTDALTLHVVEDKDAGTGVVTVTKAEDLVELDGQTSVKVKVDATQIEGTYAKLDAVYVSGKAGFSNLGNETVKITDKVNAARVDSILKATTGVVTATVADASASDLVANLKNAKNDVLTLKITATETKASDLKILDAKTSVAVNANEITKLVGNAADVKTVLNSKEITLGAAGTDRAIEVTGKISAADANTITNATTGKVTAEVTAGTAKALNDALTDTQLNLNALKLTVTGTTANASDLNGLNTKTTEDVNAAAIKTVIGSDLSLLDIYTGSGVKAGLSGLGNEAVTVTNEALVANIKSINLDTTGVINVSSVTTDDGTGVTTFELADLGDLDGITGLNNLNTADGVATAITLSIADLLAANDSKKSFDFSVTGESGDTLNFTNVSGWTSNKVVDDKQYTFTKGTQTITVNLTGFDAGDVLLPA